MPVAEAELRPKKAQFHLKTADAILADILAALGQESPKSAAARAVDDLVQLERNLCHCGATEARKWAFA